MSEDTPHSGVAQDPHAIPLQRGPLGTYYQYHASYAASDKGMSSGEKQALVAGVFVMASLAVALGIGWWITPPSPPSLADIESRRAQQPVLMATEEEGFANDDAPAPDSLGLSAITRFQQGLKETRESSLYATEQGSADVGQPPSSVQPKQAASTAKNQTLPEVVTKNVDDHAKRTRDEELRRMKAQAYSETQKDRLGSVNPAKPAKPAPKAEKSSRSASRDRAAKASKVDLSKAVAECENEVGLFYRERCKWRLCNGRWGKNGCPSYQRDARAGLRIG